jgi:hypothetical protein
MDPVLEDVAAALERSLLYIFPTRQLADRLAE